MTTTSFPKAPVGTTRLRFQFIKDKYEPIGCIAYQTKILGWNSDGSFKAEIVVGTSTRNPKDPWIRSRARDIANGRMSKANGFLETNVRDVHHLKEIVLNLVCTDLKTTNRLRRQIAKNNPNLVKTFV